jgi:hypothetical protein
MLSSGADFCGVPHSASQHSPESRSPRGSQIPAATATALGGQPWRADQILELRSSSLKLPYFVFLDIGAKEIDLLLLGNYIHDYLLFRFAF